MRECLTYDDVLLVPRMSEVVPTEVDTSTELAGLRLQIPLLSSAMDTVTESGMMVAMHRAGGVGILHKNMAPGRQREQVKQARDKLVAEGVEAMVPYKGPAANILHQLIGGLRSGMGYVGARNLSELRQRARFVRVTAAGIKENGVHDVKMT